MVDGVGGDWFAGKIEEPIRLLEREVAIRTSGERNEKSRRKGRTSKVLVCRPRRCSVWFNVLYRVRYSKQDLTSHPVYLSEYGQDERRKMVRLPAGIKEIFLSLSASRLALEPTQPRLPSETGVSRSGGGARHLPLSSAEC
jgi:hypothetical protein